MTFRVERGVLRCGRGHDRLNGLRNRGGRLGAVGLPSVRGRRRRVNCSGPGRRLVVGHQPGDPTTNDENEQHENPIAQHGWHGQSLSHALALGTCRLTATYVSFTRLAKDIAPAGVGMLPAGALRCERNSATRLRSIEDSPTRGGCAASRHSFGAVRCGGRPCRRSRCRRRLRPL